MSDPRTPHPNRPTGGRPPGAPNRPSHPTPPPKEESGSDEQSEGEDSPTMQHTHQQTSKPTQNPEPQPPVSLDWTGPARNNPPPNSRTTSPKTTGLTVSFESPPMKEEPSTLPVHAWDLCILPKKWAVPPQSPTEEEMKELKQKMEEGWKDMWEGIQEGMGPEKAELFRQDFLRTIQGPREATLPPYQPRTFANLPYVLPNPYSRQTPAPNYGTPVPPPAKKPIITPTYRASSINPPRWTPAEGDPGRGPPVSGRPAAQPAGQRARFQRGFWDAAQGVWMLSLAPGTGPNDTPKIATPDEYDGVSKGAKAEEFVSKCESYFRFKAHFFNNDGELVAWAMLFLTDKAWSWVQPIIDNPADIRSQNWAAFVHAFDLNFGKHDTEGKSEQKIQELKQVRSAADYTSEFNNLAVRIRWNNQALIDQYKRGLKTEIMKAGAIVPWPNTLQEVQERAVYMDDELFKARRLEGRGPSNPQLNRRPFATRTPNVSQVQPRTQTNTTNTRQWQPRARKPITKAQKKERRKKGLCLYCGKEGHFAHNCPSKTNILAAQLQEDTIPEEETTLDPFDQGKEGTQ